MSTLSRHRILLRAVQVSEPGLPHPVGFPKSSSGWLAPERPRRPEGAEGPGFEMYIYRLTRTRPRTPVLESKHVVFLVKAEVIWVLDSRY